MSKYSNEDEKSQPAKLSDRERDGQANGKYHELNSGNTYGMGNKFNEASKVTKETNGYAGYDGEAFNDSQKNASISRLDLVGKKTANSPTAYNSDPIPETYKPATSNGVPDANAVEYKTDKKDRG